MKRSNTRQNWKHEKAEQLAIFMWAYPSATEEERAKSIGISRTTLWRYWKDNEFSSAVMTASNVLSAKAQPLVDSALIRKAVGGDVSAMRLFYQICGKLSEKREGMQPITTDVTVTIKRAS